jgi:hypothetical protein
MASILGGVPKTNLYLFIPLWDKAFPKRKSKVFIWRSSPMDDGLKE